MLKLFSIRPKDGSRRKKKKVARGTSSGHGKTGGRGHKGQRSRAGGTKGIRFEGGQTPLYRRLPKIGSFKNYPFRKVFNIINVSDLNVFEEGSSVTKEDLIGMFFSSSKKRTLLPVKILGGGDLKKALKVEADKFSKSAVEKIELAKGSILSR